MSFKSYKVEFYHGFLMGTLPPLVLVLLGLTFRFKVEYLLLLLIPFGIGLLIGSFNMLAKWVSGIHKNVGKAFQVFSFVMFAFIMIFFVLFGFVMFFVTDNWFK
jgi:hypothetical protein